MLDILANEQIDQVFKNFQMICWDHLNIFFYRVAIWAFIIIIIMVIIRFWRLAIHQEIRRWICKPSRGMQNQEQWVHWKSVVTSAKVARWRCFVWIFFFTLGFFKVCRSLVDNGTLMFILVGFDVSCVIAALRTTGVWECDVVPSNLCLHENWFDACRVHTVQNFKVGDAIL